ncbi:MULTISPECIES: hypothetical protein [unclassified Mesorhizobium]|uniref:hypothetical protein n=1 Tax=unclassified Mesorhizobium TaxID=325217 RepID=UPI0016721061|nr:MULTISPECIES: hypothetical protein [unclassified Mesorhizobium]
MSAAAKTRIYTVCTTYSGELVRRIEAESEYEARYLVSRITGRLLDSLTTSVKPVAWR